MRDSSANGMSVTEIHSGDEAHLSRVLEVTPEGMVVSRSPALTNLGRHVWLELGLPADAGGGLVRILAEVVGRGPQITRFRFKHVWPRDRATCRRLVSEAKAA